MGLGMGVMGVWGAFFEFTSVIDGLAVIAILFHYIFSKPLNIYTFAHLKCAKVYNGTLKCY